MEEENFEEDDEIHCMEDKGSATFLTKAAYEKSLFNDQINQEWDGKAVLQTEDWQRYNLRSKANIRQSNKISDREDQQLNQSSSKHQLKR